MRSKRNSWNSPESRRLLTLLLLLSLAVAAPAAEPADSEALLKQADRYFLDGKPNQARATYERALAAGAPIKDDYRRAQRLGLCYLNGKPANFDKAARWLKAALRLRPGDEDIRMDLARSLVRGGRQAEALPHFRALAKAHPNNAGLVRALANALYGADSYDESFSVLSAYLQRRPRDTRVRLEYAHLLAYNKKYPEAEEQFQFVLKSEPANATALIGLAKLNAWRANFAAAVELYDKVLARNPQNYEAAKGKAITLAWMRRREEAHALLEALAQRNPSDKEVAAALTALEERAAEAAAAPPPPPKPPPPVKSEQEIFVAAAMAQAAAATSRGNYVEAIHEYHRVLERDPQNLKAKLQIARVLAWSRNYAEAAVEYEEFLRAVPENQVARRERARVLSWARKFDDSLAEYGRVLKEAEATRAAGQPEQVSIDEVRLEYARVFSWARRYDEALAQFDLLLPEGAVREPKHKDMLIEKARVLAWSRRYDQSIATYDQALILAPGDFDARLGKAQATFWAGKLDEAATLFRPLLDEQPKNAQTSYALAAVERRRGYNARALGLLKDAPQNAETEKLRSSIRADLRPLLRLRYGFQDDRELSARGTDSTYTAHRFTAGIEFFPHPDVAMEIFNTVTSTNTSNRALRRHGADALATETFARVTFKAAPWLRMILGAGGGTSGRGTVCPLPLAVPCTTLGQDNRRQTFLYEVHPIITYRDLRLEFVGTRRLAEFDSLSIHDNVVRREESIAASYFWRRRVRFGAEFWHATYNINSPDISLPSRSFETAAVGGDWWIRPILYRNDRITVDGGFRMDMYAFDDRVVQIADSLVSAGFYAPQRHLRYSVTGHVGWDVTPKVSWDFDGSVGPQRNIRFRLGNPPPTEAQCSAVPLTPGCPPAAEFRISGTFSTRLTLRLGRWSPFFGYSFYTSRSAAFPTFSDSGFRSHAFTTGLSYRF